MCICAAPSQARRGVLPLGVAGPTKARQIATIPSFDPYAFTDGRFVSFALRERGTLLYDTLRGRKRRLAECAVDGAAPRHFLTACKDRAGTTRTGMLLARARRIVTIRSGGADLFTRMGRNWLLGNNPAPEAPYPHWVWLNWHTGQRFECDAFGEPECDDFRWDLDSTRRAQMPPGQLASTPAYSLRLTRPDAPASDPHALVLWRRGRRGPSLATGLHCLSPRQCHTTLDKGAVTWGVFGSDGRSAAVEAYSIHTHARVHWRLTMHGQPMTARLIHTKYGVVIWAAATRRYGATGPWHVYFVHWPPGWR